MGLSQVNSRKVILSAGAPHYGNKPALLESVNGMSVFDWLLDALSVSAGDVDLVLGYQSDELAGLYAGMQIVVNNHWQTTGSAYSLMHANFADADELLVCYGDLLFRQKLIHEINQLDAPVVVAWDSQWKQRYVGRNESDLAACEKVIAGEDCLQRLGHDVPIDWADGEFIGVVRFSGEALTWLRLLQKDKPDFLKKQHLSGLIEYLRVQGLRVVGLDVEGDWAEVNHPRDIAHFVLGTKAETLARLRNLVTSATIQDQVSFTASFWQENSGAVLEQIEQKFSNRFLVVRSSARSEDAFTHSNAGAYTSLLNVDSRQGLDIAIEEVLASYEDLQLDDQVLVQPMVQQVVMSGVAFTRTLETAAPYLVINYEESGSTDGITSGHSNDHKTLYVRRDSTLDQVADQRLVNLVKALNEIERLLAYDALDIEFALDASGQVHILQVRPIAVEQTLGEGLSDLVFGLLSKAEMNWQYLQKTAPHIYGNRAVFGIMPDWNPAEIIGTHPGALATSLYRYLILDETWATQRAEYGYRDVRPQGLLVEFAGKPYIDVRASFNSFVPASVNDALAGKLVDFYLEWLCKHPELHDKVEFDVVPTCLGLDFGRWEARLLNEAGLSAEEIAELREGLLAITAGAIMRTSQDLTSLSKLEKRFEARNSSEVGQPEQLLQEVWLLLEECRLFGTLPFAHLARSGFVAVTLLKEAVKTGALSEAARDDFMSSLRTVSHELSEDARKAATGEQEWSAFVAKYGHLRPGTYDIKSSAYQDDPEKYLRPLLTAAHEALEHQGEAHWLAERSSFFNALRQQGLDFSDQQLEDFLRAAIEGREKAKFIFSRNLSAALNKLAAWGDQLGIERELLAHLSIHQLLEQGQMEICSSPKIQALRTLAESAMADWECSMACELPALITSKNDFYSFQLEAGQPNFIGMHSVQALSVNLAEDPPEQQPNVEGCLVMIPRADPGYDWLFGQGIAGLITMYGGANSHMAIRAAEFGLPAAIGVGEQLYRQLSKGRSLELDPGNSCIRILH